MVETIPVRDVVIGEGRRPIDPGHVKRLSISITELGLLHPIIVSLDNVLIAGRHRLEAVKLLKLKEIACQHLDLSEIDTQIAEVDENLLQKQMLPGERANLLARSKQLYLAKHPETGKGKYDRRGEHKGAERPYAPAFTQDRVEKTGMANRTIKEFVQIGEAFTDEQLTKLDQAGVGKKDMIKLSRKSEEVRQTAVDTVAKEGAVAVKHFVSSKQGHKTDTRDPLGEPAKGRKSATVLANGVPIPNRFVNPGQRQRNSDLYLSLAIDLKRSTKDLAAFYTPVEWAELDVLVTKEYEINE